MVRCVQLPKQLRTFRFPTIALVLKFDKVNSQLPTFYAVQALF